MKKYELLEMEVVVIQDDIIRTSEGGNGGVELPEVPLGGLFGNNTF